MRYWRLKREREQQKTEEQRGVERLIGARDEYGGLDGAGNDG
jgi:hypothetical protein